MTIHRRRGGGYGWYYTGFAFFAVCVAIAIVAVTSGMYSVHVEIWRPIVGLLAVGAVALVLRARSGSG